jgi:hypothetical protein
MFDENRRRAIATAMLACQKQTSESEDLGGAPPDMIM